MSTLIVALATGSIYTLLALGYNVIYQTTNIFNFAQGALVAVGSLLAYSLVVSWGIPAGIAFLAAAVLGLALVVVEYFVAVKPLSRQSAARRGSADMWLVSTLGASVVLEAGAEMIWGSDPLRVPIPALDHLVAVGSSNVHVASFAVIGAAIVGTLGLEAWYMKTRTGKVFRAVAEDREAAEVRGIDAGRVALASFAIGGVLAGLVSVLVVPLTFASANLGQLFIIKAFVVLALGGFGSNRGALIGGWIIGLVETYVALELGVNYQDLVVFVLLLLILVLRPHGIFGQALGRQV